MKVLVGDLKVLKSKVSIVDHTSCVLTCNTSYTSYFRQDSVKTLV